MMKALITGVSNPTGLALLKTLGAGGVDLHAADSNRHAPGMSLVKRWHRLVIPPTGGEEVVDSIVRHCLKKRIQVVMPATDEYLSLLSEHEEAFEQRAIRLMVPSARTRLLAEDRAALFGAFEGVLPVPKHALFDDSLDLSDWRFPVILRPRARGGEREQRLFATARDLARIPRSEDLIVEEPLFGEVAFVDVMAGQDGDVLAAVPRSEYRDSRDRPVAVTTHDETLELLGRRAAELADVRFAASIEVRRVPRGAWKISGIIPRCTGAAMLTAKSGVNIPLLCLKEVLGEPIHREELRYKEVGMVRAPASTIQVKRRRSRSRSAPRPTATALL